MARAHGERRSEPAASPAGSRRPVAFGLRIGVLVSFALLAACNESTVNVLEVAEVAISPAELSVVQGTSEALSATPRDAQGRPLSGRSVGWSSDDPSVAAVSTEGVVAGHTPGTTWIRATADGVEGSAFVTVIPGPSIELSAASVEWEAPAGDPGILEAEIQVTNAGGGTLEGLEVELEGATGSPPAWLEATLRSATSPTVLDLRASTAELEPGDYTATAIITSPAAVDGPAELQIQLRVAVPPPVLVLDPTSWSAGAPERSLTPSSQTVAVTNAGGGELDELSVRIQYTGGGPTGWLSAELESDTAPTQMELEASSRFLDPGEYTAVVRVRSPAALNEYEEVSVTFTVQARSSQVPIRSLQVRTPSAPGRPSPPPTSGHP